MEQTSKYKLPQWAEDDRIMMEDFNNAMAAIEGGMSQAQQAAESAMETAQEGVAKGTAAMAAAEKNCMVKLFETTLTGSANSIQIDLSGVDMSQVNRLVIQAEGYFSNGSTGFKLRINNSGSAVYYGSMSDTARNALPISPEANSMVTVAELFPMNGYISMHYHCTSANDKVTYFTGTNYGGAAKVCAMSGIKSLTLHPMTFDGTVYPFQTNTHVAVYAIKK